MDISRQSLYLGFFRLLFRLYGTELYGILRANLMTAKASEKICGPGEEGKLLKVMKLIQTHLLAFLAGNTLPKDSLASEIDGLLMELEMLKAKSHDRGE